MNTLLKANPASAIGIPNWKKTPYKPTPDEIIEAYEAGKKVGMSEHDKIVMREFGENLNQACKLSENLFHQLNKHFRSFCKGLYLKVNGLSDFEALFIVDRAIYISNSRKEVFSEARKVKRDSKRDLFSISFSFLPQSASLDLSNIFYDGYSLSYEPRSKPKTRKA